MPPQRSRRTVTAALLEKCFELDQSGMNRDHDRYVFRPHGHRTNIFTYISRGSSFKTLQVGVLKYIQRELKLSMPQLLDLVDCSLSCEDYLSILRSKKIADLPDQAAEAEGVGGDSDV